LLLAVSLWGTWGLIPAALAAGGPEQVPQRSAASATFEQSTGMRAQLVDNSWQQTAILAVRQAVGVIVAGYEKAPVLVIVLSALLVLPAVALASWVLRAAGWLAKSNKAPRAPPAEPLPESDAEVDEPARATQAWLAIEGEAAGRHRLAGEMIRVGRHPDNEIWLTDTSVHHYHAVIHRTEDDGFSITDLSGQEGNGVRVNGTRRARSPLVNGDVIELGKARMTFAMAAN
jgi:hypothetical protein